MAKLELAAAIVVHKRRVLVVRRSKQEAFLPRHWGIPCGKIDVDDGESSREAVLRELREETGLIGEIVESVGTSYFMSSWQGEPTENIQENFLVRLDASARLRPGLTLKPRVKTPRRDQRAKWIPIRRIRGFGLDDHNLGAILQGVNPSQPDTAELAAQFGK